MSFGKCTPLCNHDPNQDIERFPFPKHSLVFPYSLVFTQPPAPNPQSQETTNLLSVTIVWSVLKFHIMELFNPYSFGTQASKSHTLLPLLFFRSFPPTCVGSFIVIKCLSGSPPQTVYYNYQKVCVRFRDIELEAWVDTLYVN